MSVRPRRRKGLFVFVYDPPQEELELLMGDLIILLMWILNESEVSDILIYENEFNESS